MRGEEQPLDIHLPSVPPIVDINLTHRLERLQPPSIVHQDIQPFLTESRLYLLRSAIHALFIENVQLDLQNLWCRVIRLTSGVEDLGLEGVQGGARADRDF